MQPLCKFELIKPRSNGRNSSIAVDCSGHIILITLQQSQQLNIPQKRTKKSLRTVFIV